MAGNGLPRDQQPSSSFIYPDSYLYLASPTYADNCLNMSSEVKCSSADAGNFTTACANNLTNAFSGAHCEQMPYDPSQSSSGLSMGDVVGFAIGVITPHGAPPAPVASSSFLTSLAPVPVASSSFFSSLAPAPVASSSPLTSLAPVPVASSSFLSSLAPAPVASSSLLTSWAPAPVASSSFLSSLAPAPVASSSFSSSLAPVSNQSLFTPDCYRPSQHIPSDMAHRLQTQLEHQPVPGPSHWKLSGSSLIEPSDRFRLSTQGLPGHVFDSSERTQVGSEENQLASNIQSVKMSVPACALVDRAPSVYQPLQQPISQTHSNKRARSSMPVLGGTPELAGANLAHQTPVYLPTGAGMEYHCGQGIDKEPLWRSRLAQGTPHTDRTKRHPEDKDPSREMVVQSDASIVPCEPIVLPNKTTDQDIVSQAPDSVNRPENRRRVEGGSGSAEVKNADERGKTVTIEQALAAVETLTEFLWAEASEGLDQTDSLEDDAMDCSGQGSPDSDLAPRSPFLMLGEIGSKLKLRIMHEHRAHYRAQRRRRCLLCPFGDNQNWAS